MLMVLNAGFFADQHSADMAKIGINAARFPWDVSLVGMAAVLLCAKEPTRLLLSRVRCSQANAMIYR